MMKRKNDEDVKILMDVLTESEFATITEAYKLYKSIEDEEQKTLLLRRIDDVISMARYIIFTGEKYNQTDYEILGERLSNLNIAISNIKNPITKETTLNYFADSTNTPLILRSIEYLDNQRHEEVDSLIEHAIRNNGNEETTEEGISILRGSTHYLVFVRKENNIVIYDIDNRMNPQIKKEDLISIKEACEALLNEENNNVVQKIYDEMVYQAINFHMQQKNAGYRLIKRKD